MAGLPLRPTSGPLLSGTLLYVGGVAAELRGYRAETGVLAARYDAPSDLAAPPQHLPGKIPELDTMPLGVEVPLTAPPVPVSSATPPSPEPPTTPLYELPGVLTMDPAGPIQDD
jgi:hypothetical protein